MLAHNFTEPSLVYHLGIQLRLGDQIKLDGAVPPGTVLISDVARADAEVFDTRLSEAGLCREEFAKFDGFNYSRSDPVTIKLSQITICPAAPIEPAAQDN